MALFAAQPVFAQDKTWDVDVSHTKVQFTVSHMVVSSVTGDFKVFGGTAVTKGNDFADATVNFSIDVDSINTDSPKRDAHLKSDHFFNVEKHPKITFKSKSMKKTGDNTFKLIGDMTIRDVTKTVELDATLGGFIVDNRGNDRAGLKITGSINRFDYNLTWNKFLEAGGAMVGKTVDILCNVELIHKKNNDNKKG
ncbi:MAG: YceI family protein [Candidatus Anammoxibacter sp.]